MCGRFANAIASRDYVPQIQRHYPDLNVQGWADDREQEQWRPRYNITPRSNVPVIRRERGELVVRVMNWSVVPHWTKHEQGFGERLKTINARSESIQNPLERSSLWMSLAPAKRCLIPVQGFYEWLTKGKGPTGKAPYYTRNPTPSELAGEKASDYDPADVPPLMFAGLWDSVTYEETDKALLTFTILTTTSSPRLKFLHTRMPCILRTTDEMQAWIDCEPAPRSTPAGSAIAKEADQRNKWTPSLAALLKPFGETEQDLSCYAVPQEVNKVGSESATFVHPVEERKDGIESLFKKQFDKGAKPAVASTSGGSSGGSTKGRLASPTKPRVDVKGKGKAKEEEDDDQEVQLLSDDDEDEVKGGGTMTRLRKDHLQKGKAVSEEDTAAVKVLSDEDDEVVVLDTSEPEIIEKDAKPKKPFSAKKTSSTSSTPSSSKKRKASDVEPDTKPSAADRKKKKGKITGWFERQ